MGKPKMTLKKIATELGVSISTVSKALHDNKEISRENREKIKAFAKFYNYRPNNIALSLKHSRKSKNIGIIIPEIVHNFFAKVISGIEIVANARGYNVLIAVSNESFDKEVINMELLVNGSIDGFILSLSKETLQRQDYHHIKETIDQGMPIVLFDRVVDEVQCDKVIVDDAIGAEKAVELLLETGCENILLLTTKDYITIGKLRTEGYIRALQKHHIAARSEFIHKIREEPDLLAFERRLEKDLHGILDRYPEIDAVFGVNEIYAVTALNVASERGLKVPDDLSIVSFSNGILSQNSRPHLTTVDQHGEEIGKEAAKMLIDRLEGQVDEEIYTTKIIETSILKRDSTRIDKPISREIDETGT